MRIVIVADTHGYLDPRIAEHARGADWVVHAGDVGAGMAAACGALGQRLQIVAGNNDPADSPWPTRAEIDLPGGTLAIMHGHQWPARVRHDRLRAYFADARAVVLGHSHRRVLDTQTTPWLINPGAAGKSRAYGGPSYVELIAQDHDWQITPHVFTPRSRMRGR